MASVMDEMDLVVKDLADPHRRLLLDVLRARSGQTLIERQGHLPMTRFGVMKQLKVLEATGLVLSRKVGREKLHDLNAPPNQQISDRWVSRYAKPWARSLTGLKHTLKEETMIEAPTVTQAPTQMFQVHIRTTPERLWQALTDGEWTRRYYYGSRAESSWEPGAPYRYIGPDGGALIVGKVLESDPPRRFVTTFSAVWDPAAAALPPPNTGSGAGVRAPGNGWAGPRQNATGNAVSARSRPCRRHCGVSSTRRSPGRRRRTAPIAIGASSRASGAPTQKWMP